MSWLDRLRRVFAADHVMDRRIDEEMAHHLEMRAAELMARGMKPEEAVRAARLAFGNRTAVAESTRAAHTVEWLEQAGRDLRFAARSLARQPGLVLTALASLALGIGVNTAIFATVDAVALRPLPIQNLDRLHVIEETKAGQPSNGNPLRLADWGAQVSGFEAVTGYYGDAPRLTGLGDPVRFDVLRVFGDYFRAVGGRPVAGRLFTEMERGGEPVAVLRAAAATRLFGAVDSALGRLVTLDGAGYTVVGVMPDATYPTDVAAWIPAARGLQQGSRAASFLLTVGLLAPGRDPADVEGELALVQARLARAHPATDAERRATLKPLQAALLGPTRAGMLVVQGIALLVLAIACLNLASLFLARAAARHRESAIRAALGAGRGSLVRLYLVEGLLLGVVGGLLGVGVAALATPVLRAVDLPIDLPRLGSAALDLRAIGFAVVLSLAAILVFGTAPALAAARGSLVPALGRMAPRNRLRGAIVAAQAGLAVMLLLAAGALVAGVRRLDHARGYAPEGVLTVRTSFSWGTPPGAIHDFSARALESFAAMPGVRAVGLADRLPLEGGSQSSPVTVAGRILPPALDQRDVRIRAVSPGYFAAMGIPMASGRALGGRATAVVNEAFAHEWLGDRPLGRRVTFFNDQTVEVVGVVAGVRQSALADQVEPEIFIDAGETYWPLLVFLLRTGDDPMALAGNVRDRVREIDPGLVIDAMAPMTDALDDLTRTPRLVSTLVTGFAAVALLLVAVGLAGILTGYVNQRTTEIGVRLAIGAGPGAIVRQVAGHGYRLVSGGLVAGAVAWVLFGRLLEKLPVEVRPDDPILLMAGIGSFLVLAGLGCLLPAWRAARVDPVIALRAD